MAKKPEVKPKEIKISVDKNTSKIDARYIFALLASILKYLELD